MRIQTASFVLFVLTVVGNARLGDAARSRVNRKLRGMKGHLRQQNALSESDSENYSRRGLDGEDPPCTYYYPAKKSKFNKYDDDWYNPCKNSNTGRPSYIKTFSPTASPRIRPPSQFYSTTPPVQRPPSNPWADWINPSMEIEAVKNTPRPTISSPPPAPKPTMKPTPSPVPLPSTVPMPSNTPLVSVETSNEVQGDADVFVDEKESSCLSAKSGQVIPTSINFTIYYKYELLAERNANMTDVIWPEIDRAFQHFLSSELVECEMDVEGGGGEPTFASRLKSISPKPFDSVGSLYPTGWSENTTVDGNATACTHIVLDEKLLTERELYCDVVTGSVTLYLSEVAYMDAASNPYVLFIDYSNDVIQFLRNEINEGGEAITNFMDESLGVRGFYFISESPISNLGPTLGAPDAASDQIEKSSGSSSEKFSSIPGIAASLAAITVFATVAAAGLAIHRKRQHLDEPHDTFKSINTPRTYDDDVEFYGPEELLDIDISDDGSTGDDLRERDGRSSKKTLFPTEDNITSLSRTSEYDVQEVLVSDFATVCDLYETCDQQSINFEYSQLGVPMRLRSPDGTLSRCNPTKCKPSPRNLDYNTSNLRLDPSIDYSRMDPEPDDQFPDDESSVESESHTDNQPISEDPESSSKTRIGLKERESNENLSTKSSTSTSSALDYILSLGSSIMSPPQKPFDESSVSSAKCGSTNAVIGLGQESEIPHVPSVTDTATSLYLKRTTLTPNSTAVSESRSLNRNSTINQSLVKTLPPSSSDNRESKSSTESTPGSSKKTTVKGSRSSSSKGNEKSPSDRLKNRRKSLESRFQNYRRSLSESINNLGDTPAGSWSASREFTRSVSLYKNSGQPFSSPVTNLANSILNAGTKKELNESTVDSQEKRRSQSSKAPRVHKHYTSLNDIEDILEKEESTRVAEESSRRSSSENEGLETSLSPNNPQQQQQSYTSPEPLQFQPNTVML